MLKASPEELIDLSDELYELAGRLRAAATLAPERHPNEYSLQVQMLTSGDWLSDAAGLPTGLPVLTAAGVVDELYQSHVHTLTEVNHHALPSV